MQENILLNKYYRPLNIDPAEFTRQFFLSKNPELIPDGWKRYNKGQWCLGVSELPVLGVVNASGINIGWCIGYPIHNKNPWKSKIVINCEDDGIINMSSIEDFYHDTGGRFVLVLIMKKEAKLFLDPGGSLSAVFSTSEKTVASTPTLFGEKYDWDEEIIRVLNMPESELWFPSGLTPKKGIKRILPNHYLDLNAWRVARHWPRSSSDLTIEDDIDKNVSIISSCLIKTIGIVAERYPIQMTLTAGRDSRMVLACAREFMSKISFFTQSDNQETIDMHIAKKLAKRLGLQHSFIPIKTATDDEMLRWLYLTGHAIGGAIMKIHKTVESYDRQSAVINGIFGEVGRAYYCKKNDSIDMKITAEEIHERRQIPHHNRILSATEKWLSGLSGYNIFQILDLFFIEQGEGCGESPKFYTNTISLFGISPFNHRKIFKSMLKLPYDYRLSLQLPIDICLKQWPELLDLPFNEYTGIKNYLYKTRKSSFKSAKKITKKIAKKLLLGR
jgi:hypothetical protein